MRLVYMTMVALDEERGAVPGARRGDGGPGPPQPPIPGTK